tara:strand:+ start:297 stop:1040 length:744 start_codon:yes stop_codon:yes gene_type:complete
MKKIILFITILIIITYGLSEFAGDRFIKKILESNISNSLDRDTEIGNLKINYLKGEAIAKNIKLNNKNFSKDLLNIDNIYIKLDTASIFSNIIKIDTVDIEGLSLNYFFELKIKGLKDYKNVDDNVKSLDKTMIEGSNNSTSSKQFNINKLNIRKNNLSINNSELKINDQISLKDMQFNNIGNTKNSNDYKKVIREVLKMIVDVVKTKIITGKLLEKVDMIKKLNKDNIKDKIKDKLKDKLKKLISH